MIRVTGLNYLSQGWIGNLGPDHVLHPVTKYCFDDPRLNGLWKHGGGISAGIGLADRIPRSKTSMGGPVIRATHFRG